MPGVLKAGIREWVRSSRGRVAARRACIARQLVPAGEAVPYYARMACVTRHGRRQMRSIAELCRCARRIDPRGARHTPSRCPPLKPNPPHDHQTGYGAPPGAVSPDPDMHDAPIDARRRSRGLSRMPHTPHTPRPTGTASNGASSMLRNPQRLPTGTPHPHSRCPPLKTQPDPRPPWNQRPHRRARTPGGTGLPARPARHPCLA